MKLRPIIFYLFLSILIVLSWFRHGLYYGGAEVGLSPFYNPARYLDIQRYIWWGDVAPGSLVPQFISAVPLYFILSILQNLLTPLVLQGFLFFCLIFLMGYGMYSFVNFYIERTKTYFAVIAGVFYMFNSYVLVEVWHRFLYTGIFLSAAIPILALFWQKWIREGRLVSLIIFLLINLSFSYMYGNLTSFIALWIMCLLFVLAEAFSPWKGKKFFLKLNFKFFLGFSLFLLTNLWWLMPVLKVSTTVLPEQHSMEGNLSTLVNISKQTTLPFLLQYANPFYLFYSRELGNIYSNFIFLIIPWLPAVVIFVGLFESLKNKILVPIGFFYLLALVIAKGAAAPFGYPYLWGFMNIFIVGIIRNPFEKLGILVPFFGSLLFVIGLRFLNSEVKKPLDIISKSLVFATCIGVVIYAFPMFTGRVFNKPDNPLKTKVPPYYLLADNWLKSQKNSLGNILHLPFSDKDVVTYNWDDGYHGVEINEILFTAFPSITRNVGIQKVDNALESLSFIFNPPFSSDKKKILKLLQSFNVQYIVLHKETKWDDVSTYGKSVNLMNPLAIEETLNTLDFLKKIGSFGELVIYKMKDEFYQPKVIFADNPEIIYPGDSNIMQTLGFNNNEQITPTDNSNEKILSNSYKLTLFPERVFYSWEPSKTSLEAMINQIRTDTNEEISPFNKMSIIKEKFFSQTGELLSESIVDNIISANNILIHLTGLKRSDNSAIESLLNSYSSLIDDIFTKNFNGSSLHREFSSDIAKVFTIHLFILDQYSPETNKVQNKLRNYLIDNKVLPKYFFIGRQSEDIQRKVHQFNVVEKSKFKLLMSDIDNLNLYHDLTKINFQLDGKDIQHTVEKINNTIDLGEIDLDEGIHEISYAVSPSINLLPTLNKFNLEGSAELVEDQEIKLKANPQTGSAAQGIISSVNGGDIYQLDFEANFSNTKEFYIEVLEDTQSSDSKDDCSKTVCFPVRPNPSIQGFQKFSITTTAFNLATRKADLRILLPLNNDSISMVQIRNINLSKIMSNNLILTVDFSGDKKLATSSAKLIDIKKLSPVEYKGKIELEKPSFMFFKETFNPNWKLELSKDNTVYKMDEHFIGDLYSNAYFIDKVGEYDFKLEFEPQHQVNLGITISAFSWIGIFGAFSYFRIKSKFK